MPRTFQKGVGTGLQDLSSAPSVGSIQQLSEALIGGGAPTLSIDNTGSISDGDTDVNPGTPGTIDAVTLVVSLDWEVASDAAFSNIVLSTTESVSPFQLTVPGRTMSGTSETYYARYRANYDDLTQSGYSETISFTTSSSNTFVYTADTTLSVISGESYDVVAVGGGGGGGRDAGGGGGSGEYFR